MKEIWLDKAKLSATTGCGYVWLVFDRTEMNLGILYTFEQHVLIKSQHLTPLLSMDLWEHSYLSFFDTSRSLHKNSLNILEEYASWFWSVVNWPVVQRRLNELPVPIGSEKHQRIHVAETGM